MTLKDYIIQNLPSAVSSDYDGGVYGCPETYQCFNHLDLQFPCFQHDSNPEDCEICWNQPYTPPTNIEETPSTKTYEDGLTEAWEFAQSMLTDEEDGGIPYNILSQIYGNIGLFKIITSHSYQEVRSKYDQASNKLEVGDEITDGETTGYIIYIDKDGYYINNAYKGLQFLSDNYIEDFHRTGRHNAKLAEAIKDITE